MKIPISWLEDFIDLEDLSVEEIARLLTLAGLEVDEIRYVGMPMPTGDGLSHEFKFGGIAWDADKIVVAEIREVMPHPNADRLTLLDLYDGSQQQTVLTGAPNIFHLKGQGRLQKPLKVAYAKEGATLYDGHAEGLQLMTLKRTKIRGVESYSMVCSEKELGISEDHEGIIVLDDEAPVGTSLLDYMGDAVLDISILPNMARNANVIGVARELAALTNRKLKKPTINFATSGDPVKDSVSIQITNPELNPRFVLGLIRNVEIKDSPYWIQRRLKLAGMRPINCIVDATNYAMLELGEPLHAFDYDVLKERAGKKAIRIITRSAFDGEKLITLDGIERRLMSMNVLVCDEKGPLSIAGVMGGVESEVRTSTRNVLLEGAAWNFINIRRTAKQHDLPSEASFRFSRGVHPALAYDGVKRGLQFMGDWSGGKIAPGLVDDYPIKPKNPKITITTKDVHRLLGIELKAEEITKILKGLEFQCEIKDGKTDSRKSGKSSVNSNKSRVSREEVRIVVTAPANRLDIGDGVVGQADVLEEIARVYGYDRLPATNLTDALPPQVGNPAYEWEEHLRDLLIALGFNEVVSYRLTSAERDARLGVSVPHVRIANPIAPDKNMLRRSVLASVLDNLEHNIRLRDSLAFFELGPAFEPSANELPNEVHKLAIAMTGTRSGGIWNVKDSSTLDFFDLKGRIELLLQGLHTLDVTFVPTDSIAYLHPGKAAQVKSHDQPLGIIGELHPAVKNKYDFSDAPILVAEFDLDSLRVTETSYEVTPVPEFPPVLEDIAIIVDDGIPAASVESLIRQTGGKSVTNIQLFDVYHGEQVGAGKKSLAYSLTYQAHDKTMTDAEAASIRKKIVKRLEQELGAELRG